LISALWRFRHFVVASILGELRRRFTRSRIGLMWSVLHPLGQATIFAIFLAEVLGTKIGGVENKAAYAIYLMAGLAAWGLFSDIVTRCLTVFIEHAEAMKKIAFPRICLPAIVIGNALLNHVLLLGAIVVVFLFFGHAPGTAWLALPIGIAFVAFFAMGLGLILGVFNVFTRDIGQVVSVVLQFWFWATPIVYTKNALPEHLRSIVELNPMTALVGIYQDVMLYDRFPELGTLAPAAAIALVSLPLAFVLFRRASSELVDVL
jgi:lipopolysaccharide transport system permease protein